MCKGDSPTDVKEQGNVIRNKTVSAFDMSHLFITGSDYTLGSMGEAPQGLGDALSGMFKQFVGVGGNQGMFLF